MKHLIIGYGEVGRAIHKVVGEAFIVDRKVTNWREDRVDVIHICIPYSKEFNAVVSKYKPYGKIVIVHSTTPFGTCDKLKVCHSPIRGVHPDLEKGVRTFIKYFGGIKSVKAANVFRKLGIRCSTFRKAKTTEALKLWDTTQYGRLIMLEKEIYAWCKENKVRFDYVYTQSNKDYNEGYVKLGRPEVVRPYLKHVEGPIGGHCVTPNAKLLKVKL